MTSAQALRLLVPVFAGLLAAAAVTPGTKAQLIVGTNAGATSEITLYDLSGVAAPRQLVTTVPTSAIAADEASQTLYYIKSSSPRHLFKAPLTPSGLLSPVQITTTAIPTAQAVQAMAWDSAAQQLIVVNSSVGAQVSTMNPTTGAFSPLWTPPAGYNIQDLTYDAASDSFYGVVSVTLVSPAAAPRALFRIQKPWSSPTLTTVAAYPAAHTTFRATAAGNGRVYMAGATADVPITTPVYPFNLVTGVYETSPSAAWPTGQLAAAAWAPTLLSPPSGTNLILSTGAPASCTIGVGKNMVFSVHVENFGATASGPATVTVTLPPTSVASFLDSTPVPTTRSPTQLTYDISDIPGYGSSSYANIKIRLTANVPDTTATLSASVSSASDTDLSNNSAAASSPIHPVAPVAASVTGVLSTNPAFVNAFVPGGGGSRFLDFADPFASPDGSYWAIHAETTATPVIVRSQSSGGSSVAVQTGTTAMSGGVVQTLDFGCSVNDSGVVAFSGDDTGPSATDYFVATTNGVSVTEIAREGQSVPALVGTNYGSQLGGPQILNSGQVNFAWGSGDPSTYMSNNGTTVVAQTGVTVPAGESAPIQLMQYGSAGTAGLVFDKTGTRSGFIAQGTAGNLWLVADGAVAIKSGVTTYPNGMVAQLNDSVKVRVGPDGDWMVAETSAERPDIVVHGRGTVIQRMFKTTDLITPGDSERWSDLRAIPSEFNPGDTFFTYQPGPGGHFVVGGFTDHTDEWRDSVLVYDGVAVIARENDPVDLDGNGLFDDDTYIRNFVRTQAIGHFNGVAAFMNDNTIIIGASLRNKEGALCHTNDTQTHWAIVRIPLPITGACCNGTMCTMMLNSAACTTSGGTYQGDRSGCIPTVTCNTPPTVTCCRGTTCLSVATGTCTGTVGGSASLAVSLCGSGGTLTTCCYADYDHGGMSTIDDLFIYINMWLASSPYTKIGGDAVAAPSIDDLFVFINLWLAGCV